MHASRISSHPSVEPLESRIAPARVFAVTSADHLISFESTDPEVILTDVTITGIPGGADIEGIDFRPANGLLYAMGSNSRLYTLDPTTGVATPVAAVFTPAVSGTEFAFDFNPATDRIRVVSADTREFFRLNPNLGTVVGGAVDALVGATGASGLAFTKNFGTGEGSRGYLINSNSDTLGIIGVLGTTPAETDGTVTTLGELGFNVTGAVGFDIGRVLGLETTLASFTVNGQQGLYTVDLETGNASFLGLIGTGSTTITDIAISPVETTRAVTIAANGRSATYTDLDGDLVTVTVTKGTLSAGNFTLRAEGSGSAGILELLDLTSSQFLGTNVTISAKRLTQSGDGQVNVGYIKATGQDLGVVKVTGDLARIDAGGGTDNKKSISSLDVLSMGSMGFATQSFLTEKTNPNALISNLLGGVAKITIRGNLDGAGIVTSGGMDAKVGTVTIIGDMVGGAAQFSGSLYVKESTIGTVKVGGSLRGGSGANSGMIFGDFAATTVTVGGSLLGSSGLFSGSVTAGKLTNITVGGDLLGGTQNFTGTIFGYNFTGKVTVKGSLFGSAAEGAGSIVTIRPTTPTTTDGLMGTVFVGGNLVGGAGKNSGSVASANKINAITVGGSFYGSSGDYSGAIHGEQLGKATINGSLFTGTGLLSGSLGIEDSLVTTTGNRTSTVTILGSVYDTAQNTTNYNLAGVIINGKTTSVKILGSVIAEGTGNRATLRFSGIGHITGEPKNASDALALTTLFIGGDVRNAEILAGYDGDNDPLRGDAGFGSVTIGGSVFGMKLIAGIDPGSDDVFGTFDDSQFFPRKTGVVPTVGAVTVKGQLLGSGTGGGSLILSGYIKSLKVGPVSVTLDSRGIDDFEFGSTHDLTVREIPAVV